jgi:hypothetical protein
MHLTINKISDTDEGDYFCHAENAFGSGTQPVSVRIRNVVSIIPLCTFREDCFPLFSVVVKDCLLFSNKEINYKNLKMKCTLTQEGVIKWGIEDIRGTM